MYLRVEGTKLVRDTRSGAIINQDKNGLDEYLTEIKSLLLKLLEKG